MSSLLFYHILLISFVNPQMNQQRIEVKNNKNILSIIQIYFDNKNVLILSDNNNN